MVWSQYVYEANANTDVLPSDEEEYDEDVHLSIEDWQIKYSDELWELWRIVEQLIHDAFLERELMTDCTFSDFAEFCSMEHTDDCDFVWIPYESNLSYIWRHIQDFLEDTGLYNEFMPGATYDHWVRFAYQRTKQNNVCVY
jgi:hypothetical protein